MNENFSLRKTLEGFEGATFYSPICGTCIFIGFDDNDQRVEFPLVIRQAKTMTSYYLDKNGRMDENGDLMIFPSYEQQDWNRFNIPNNGDLIFYSNDGWNWGLGCYMKENYVYKDTSRLDEYFSYPYIVRVKDFDFEDVQSNEYKSFV